MTTTTNAITKLSKEDLLRVLNGETIQGIQLEKEAAVSPLQASIQRDIAQVKRSKAERDKQDKAMKEYIKNELDDMMGDYKEKVTVEDTHGVVVEITAETEEVEEVELKVLANPKKKIVPTPSQQLVVDAILRWFKKSRGHSTFEFAGYAGVGKSTVVEIILSQTGLRKDEVRLCAPTGTASLVLKDKTPGYPCSTMHSLFFDAEVQKDGSVKWVPSITKIAGAKLIIMDESSMCGESMAHKILPMARKAGVPMLIVGDRGQLPPVKDNEFFFLEPDALLTEIMRQAADNPIIALSFAIRKATDEGRAYRFDPTDQNIGGKVFLRGRNKVTVAQYAKVVANGGIVIAGTNKTRQNLNRNIRQHLGFTSTGLMDGETIIVKENIMEGEGIPVTNGMRGTVSKVTKKDNGLTRFLFTPEMFEGTRYMEVNEDVLFERVAPSVLRMKNKELRSMGRPEIQIGDEVQLGYVITGHASQGAQWKTVYFIDESACFNRDANGYITQNRWLYTVVTRAIEFLVIVR